MAPDLKPSLGTHSMKLVGKRLLGGRVSFDSSAIDGTIFRFLVSLQPPTPAALAVV